MFCFPYKSLQNRENSNFRVLPAMQWSPYSSYSFTRNLQRWIKVRSFVIPVYVNLLSTFWCFCGFFWRFTSVFLFVAVTFQLVPVYAGTILVHSVSFRRHFGSLRYIPAPFLSIPFHSGVILARSGTFRYHSCPFHFIPASFCLVPVYSGLFRYIPFRSIPFLCLVTPQKTA